MDALKVREAQEVVDVLAAHVPQNEVLEPVGIVFDDPLPDLLGGLREVASIAEPVAQLAENPTCIQLWCPSVFVSVAYPYCIIYVA